MAWSRAAYTCKTYAYSASAGESDCAHAARKAEHGIVEAPYNWSKRSKIGRISPTTAGSLVPANGADSESHTVLHTETRTRSGSEIRRKGTVPLGSAQDLPQSTRTEYLLTELEYKVYKITNNSTLCAKTAL
jgi:hypothetical protein